MIDGKRSKFDFSYFRGGYDEFAVNRDKYSLKEALSIYSREMGVDPGELVAVTTEAFVRYRAGVTEDGEPAVGWWLEYGEHKTSCPVYAMHPGWAHNSAKRGYELHLIPKEVPDHG